jgi:enoyl-CoA hydratase
MWKTIYDFAKPLIAAVNGYALGGGWELAHLCDWIVASENAVFAAAEIDVGLIPYSSTVNYLTKMIGKHRAIDLVVNGTRLSADRALELGLVNSVVPPDQLMSEARALAERISARPPITVAAAKQLVVEAMSAMEHHRLERALAYSLMPLDDTVAARRARSQKEPLPEFHSR